MDHLSTPDVLAAGLDDWRKLGQALHARFLTEDLSAGAAFVAAVAQAEPSPDRQPEMRMRAGFVDVTVATRDAGIWVTEQDLTLARAVTGIAREQGLAAAPTEVAQLELGLDTADEDAIAPFWAALFTGDAGNRIHDTVLDPTGRVPNVWFQSTDRHPLPRQRWHGDLWLAAEVAPGRIEAALAVGGTLVDDSEAPSFVVLADPDGNRVCICTVLGRE